MSNVAQEEEEYFLGIIVEEQPIPKNRYKVLFDKLSKEIRYPEGLKEKGKLNIIGKIIIAKRWRKVY